MMDSTSPVSDRAGDLPGLGSVAEEGAFSGGEAEVYQSVSRAAVASLLLGLFGLLAFPVLALVILPLLSVVFAALAFRGFRKFPEELQGRPIAVAGVVLGGLCLVLAPAYHTYVYLTEVPEGYMRTNFGDLMSDKGQPDAPTIEAVELNGKPIFIKGYIHPTSMDTLRAKRFVLVPDLGTCCFGGQPPLTHMIEVSLGGDQYATKSYRKQRLAGTLNVNGSLKPIDGLTGVFYQLRADILK
ncbi:DUF3299 domain-containing protein [Aureliella helgolandensis]|uniref:DUF3299 domain-containing protein n=1 Tax=Aureliella helgolandensis TaxID=2527968 RepID=A0A518GG19_9BACT|nr:DUF3299 domain-containing protein [Aureliella helgolandensis]QDV27520.1 hypothetical protein Q31a_59090 [Aureliella helgolandensis]